MVGLGKRPGKGRENGQGKAAVPFQLIWGPRKMRATGTQNFTKMLADQFRRARIIRVGREYSSWENPNPLIAGEESDNPVDFSSLRSSEKRIA
jgi:hypothetical protein